jgi:hypothetical protein
MLLLAGLVASGCGDDPEGGFGQVGAPDKALQPLHATKQCLMRAGAVVPSRPDEMQRYARDIAQGDVEKPAAAGNGVATVAEYRPVLTYHLDKPPPRLPYVVYVGRPAEESDLDGVTAMDDGRADTFAVQMMRPSKRDIRGLRRCLDRLGL